MHSGRLLGSPLGSRLGWRVFGMFGLAAGVPLVLLSLLLQGTLSQSAIDREVIALSSAAKSAGALTSERLRVASQALSLEAGRPAGPADGAAGAAPGAGASAAAASTPASAASAAPPASRHAALQGLVLLGPDGTAELRAGQAPSKAVLAQAAAEFKTGERKLMVLTGADGAAEVLLGQRDASGGRWLATLSPAFLWRDMDDLPPGAWLCVVAAAGHPLYCSHPEHAAAAEAWGRKRAGPPADALASADRPLFLEAEFHAAPWQFLAAHSGSRLTTSSTPVGSALPLVAMIASVLVAVMSLSHIRRTLTPLQQLIDGARQMARRNLATRVEIASDDEFQELAEAFNEMAGQLELQFKEIDTLAAIDRDIVSDKNLDAILGKVASRLSDMLPHCIVAVGRLALPEGGPVMCLMAHPGRQKLARRVVNMDASTVRRWREVIEPGEIVDLGDRALTRSLFPHSVSATLTLPLVVAGRIFGIIAIGGPRDRVQSTEARRHLHALRNRAALAASAAERQRRLVHEAHHCNLTGLLNRAGLRETLEGAVTRCQDSGRRLALMFIDIDRFKSVNDTAGHAVGDEVLRHIAETLKRLVPPGGVLARQAGDEFVVMLPDVPGPHTPRELGEAICREVAQIHRSHGLTIPLGASIGVALYTHDVGSASDLMRHADLAMYEAKRNAKGHVVFFNPKLDAAAQRKAQIERELPVAIAEGELMLLFQPRVGAIDRRIESVEALIRWNHPTRGLCSPAEFIPVAEDSDLIVAIGTWVIEAACSQIAAWRLAGIEHLRVAVNLSARQLDSDRIELDIDNALARHGLDPQDLELEITESALVGETDAITQRLERLRARGLTLALDDFGTGYSSMAYLRRLPVGILKVDRSFVTDVCTDPAAQAVARAIVAMARSLNLRTVAEGVETSEQLALLCELGCDELQGYYFSKPVGPDSLVALLNESLPLGTQSSPLPKWRAPMARQSHFVTLDEPLAADAAAVEP